MSDAELLANYKKNGPKYLTHSETMRLWKLIYTEDLELPKDNPFLKALEESK